MRTTIMATAGLAAPLLVITAIQLPNAALALNPQPEPPSKASPQPSLQKKKAKRYPPNPIKQKYPPNPFKEKYPPNPFKR